MKILFTFLMICSFAAVDAQIVRTFHQTFQKEQAHLLELDVNAEVEIEKWTGSRVLVETTISLEGANRNIIEALIETGRYNLEKIEQGGALRLNFKNLAKQLIVRNNQIEEVLKLKIFVPEGMEFDESLAVK